MERKPTRPVPVPSGKKKKKTNELDQALASVRSSVDKENSEHEEIEVPKKKREDVTDEQFDQDTQGLFEPSVYHLFGVPTPPIEQDKTNEPEIGPYDELVGKVNRFTQLMDRWKSSSAYDPEKQVDLAWLEENLDRVERNTGSMQKTCPFHLSEVLKVLNPEAEWGPLYCKCSVDQCPVWCTTESAPIVLPELTQNTHPEVRAKITALQCQCQLTPRMKLSRTDKNFHRVFLTCGQRQAEPCRYFQWMHGPLWKPKRPSQPTLDQFQTKVPRQQVPIREVLKALCPGFWESRPTPQGEYFQDGQKGGGFRPPPSAFLENRPFGAPAETRTFEQQCDEINAEQVKHHCAPYSYDTYRQYGLGIF